MTTETRNPQFTQPELDLTMRLLDQGMLPNEILNEVLSLRVQDEADEYVEVMLAARVPVYTCPCATSNGPLCAICQDDAAEMLAAKDRVRERLIDSWAEECVQDDQLYEARYTERNPS